MWRIETREVPVEFRKEGPVVELVLGEGALTVLLMYSHPVLYHDTKTIYARRSVMELDLSTELTLADVVDEYNKDSGAEMKVSKIDDAQFLVDLDLAIMKLVMKTNPQTQVHESVVVPGDPNLPLS